VNRFGAHLSRLKVIGDAAGTHMHTTGSSDFQIIKSFFTKRGHADVQCICPRSNPAVRERVNLVNAKLRNAEGTVALHVGRRCKELVKDFDEVVYKPDSTVVDKEKDPKRTHLSDALGYLIWHEFRSRPSIGERDFPLF
jgi:hypothetical protein